MSLANLGCGKKDTEIGRFQIVNLPVNSALFGKRFALVDTKCGEVWGMSQNGVFLMKVDFYFKREKPLTPNCPERPLPDVSQKADEAKKADELGELKLDERNVIDLDEPIEKLGK